jgi:hypothetical protein
MKTFRQAREKMREIRRRKRKRRKGRLSYSDALHNNIGRPDLLFCSLLEYTPSIKMTPPATILSN